MNTENAGDPVFESYKRLTPEAIIRLVGENRILARIKDLHELYGIHAGHWAGTYINPHILRIVVESYFCDIYRVKFFRPVEWVDCHKRAAFTMKWISRARPIQIHNGTKPTKAALMANAYFAVVAGLTMLEATMESAAPEWWSRYIASMAYLLYYHAPDAEQLCSEMCVLQTLSDAGKAK